MKGGAQAIVQASFASGDWRGRADVLLRVEQHEKPEPFGQLVVRSRRLQAGTGD